MKSQSISLLEATVVLAGLSVSTSSKVGFPKYLKFSFHTSGDSDGRIQTFSYQEADGWGGGAGWYDYGE